MTMLTRGLDVGLGHAAPAQPRRQCGNERVPDMGPDERGERNPEENLDDDHPGGDLKDIVVGAQRLVGEPLPGEVLADPRAACLPHPAAKLAVVEKPLERFAERGDVSRRHEQARLLVDDEVAEPADIARHHGPAVSHRLRADDAEALAVRRARDDRGSSEQAL